MINNPIELRVRELIRGLDREHRPPVIRAFESSDGSLLSFIEELNSQSFDYPDLPVDDIIGQLAWDVA